MSTSLFEMRPDLAREWHPTRNGSLSPKDVTPQSGRKVWWLCQQGHWWQATVRARVRGMKCSFCRDLIRHGDQRMADLKPELLKEWHPSRNADLKARDVWSNHKAGVWWICDQGHEWKAGVPCRLSGDTCPVCKRQASKASTPGRPDAGPMPLNSPDRGPLPTDNRLINLQEENEVPYRGRDLRESRRFQQAAVVMIEYSRPGILGYAQLQNFGAGGMLLHSDFAMNPGTIIRVRFEKPMFFSTSAVANGRVIWCRSLEARGETPYRFAIGVSRI